VTELLELLLFDDDTITVPPLKAPAAPGVITTVTVTVEPDCSVAMLHTTGLLVPALWLQLPEPTVAETKAIPVGTVSTTVILVAKSGPLFVME
jgi:hypothetical protein